MKKFSVDKRSIELTSSTWQFKEVDAAETIEEKKKIIKDIINSCDGNSYDDEEFDTLEEARARAEEIADWQISQGSAYRFLHIDYCIIEEMEYDEDGDPINCDVIEGIYP